MYKYRQISISRHDSVSHAELFKDYQPVAPEKKMLQTSIRTRNKKNRNLLPVRKVIRTETSTEFDKL